MSSKTVVTTAASLPVETVASYRAQGFVHIPRVLDQEEVAGYLADARAQLDREEKLSWDDGGNVMEWVADPELTSAAMRDLALHPRVAAIAERLAGAPLRLFKTELLRKRGGDSTETPAHIDAMAFPFRGAPVTLTAWVALTDVPVERGCMAFLPGSHLLMEDLDPASAGWQPFEHVPELTWRPRVSVPLRAGDVTFHHDRTVHLAGANRTDVDRISLTSVYMDAAATFAPELINLDLQGDFSGLGPDVMRTMRSGQAMDGQRFPLLTASQEAPA
jgi:phytanoyl-CoA hydroxylase